MVVHERLTEPRVKIEKLLAKLRRFSNLPAFLDLNGKKTKISNLLSPLHWAARKGHKEIVELLISRGRVTQD